MAYIDKEKFIAFIDKKVDKCGLGYVIGGQLKDYINKQPTADVVEVRHGEWKQGIPYICSICGNPAPDEKNTSEKYSCWTSPYCPRCGAKMDGRSDT